jgi:DNA-binding NarL/FixJ family response regulator
MEVPTPRLKADSPVLASSRPAAARGARSGVAPRRLRRVALILSVYHKFSNRQSVPVMRQRQLVADLCRLIAAQLGQPTGSRGRGVGGRSLAMLDQLGLSARMRQTLEGLLAGEAEKQIAYRLRLSRHTVHVYVKGLYRHFGVSSRGELLARFVRPDAGAN